MDDPERVTPEAVKTLAGGFAMLPLEFVWEIANGEELAITANHIIPVSAGGDSHWSNLAPVCRQCNASKNSKDLLQYLLTRVSPV